MAEKDWLHNAAAVSVHNGMGQGPALIVCEHASNRIPSELDGLGLSTDLLTSHIAWDPGARAVGRHLSTAFDAPLVEGKLSRLLFDCNRPPEAPDAIPLQSENHVIPGNQNLTAQERSQRVSAIHDPFRYTMQRTLAGFSHPPIIITVHSFTPVYLGVKRDVEIGLIHDADTRLANAMFAIASRYTDQNVLLNDPYGPEDGVTHTLRAHAQPIEALNIMLEIRNDLITTPDTQSTMARMLANWISDACASLGCPLPMNAASCDG